MWCTRASNNARVVFVGTSPGFAMDQTADATNDALLPGAGASILAFSSVSGCGSSRMLEQMVRCIGKRQNIMDHFREIGGVWVRQTA